MTSAAKMSSRLHNLYVNATAVTSHNVLGTNSALWAFKSATRIVTTTLVADVS